MAHELTRRGFLETIGALILLNPLEVLAQREDNRTKALEDKTVYSISQRGVDFIKHFEKFMARPYLDAGGKPHIGYGHLIKKGEHFVERISEREGLALLRKDLARFERVINEYVEVNLSQPQYDSLVSLTFNIGENAFCRSTLLRKLNDEDYAGAAGQFEVWNKVRGKVSEGLSRRRAREKNMFLNVVYDFKNYFCK